MALFCPNPAQAPRQLTLLLLLLLSSSSILAQRLLPSAFSPSFLPSEFNKFWVSESEASYTFGFKALGQPGTFLLAVWLSKDPDQTPIWWAARDEGPALATQESSFLYDESSGFLQLRASSSRSLWRSSNSGNVRFLKTGNLQLVNGNVSVWETFQDHRNTLMLLSLTRSNIRKKPRLLQSTENQTSYANGKFHMATYESFRIFLFGIDQLGNQYVYMKDGSKVNVSGPGGNISIGKIGTGHVSIDPQLERLTLDYDGNLRVYRWVENNATWLAVWAVLAEAGLYCRATNPCGPFGICDVATSACSCPPGYSPISSTDPSRGCATTRSPPGCGQPDNQLAVMVEMPEATFYYNDQSLAKGVHDIEECKERCLKDCTCMAATFEATSKSNCQLKGNFTLGYMTNGLSRRHATLLMKLRKVPATRKGGRLAPLIAGSTFVGVVIIGTMAVILVFWRSRCLHCLTWGRKGTPYSHSWDLDLIAGPARFSFPKLVEATRNFRQLLGEGGYGKVYKGWIKDRKSSRSVVVAVKVLNHACPDDKLEAELSTLSMIHHVHLVRLHGFCTGGPWLQRKKTLLVLEYMENGSLDRHLCPKQMQRPLPWPTRLSVAVGAARGLAYLHHECNPPIVHCDIKPQNILLDKDFNAKVADFGLAARFGNSIETHISLPLVRGTIGYIAPDWFRNKVITCKTDVYSYGMLLLQLVHGLNTTGCDNMALIEWACEAIAVGCVAIPDNHESSSAQQSPLEFANRDLQAHLPEHPRQEEHEESTQEHQLRLLKVALWCVQEIAANRPFMSEVVQWIEGNEPIDDPPNRGNNSEFNPVARRIDCYYDTSSQGTSAPSQFVSRNT